MHDESGRAASNSAHESPVAFRIGQRLLDAVGG